MSEEKGTSGFRRWFCPHRRRDQGVVGYCVRCGHFRDTYISGGLFTCYVRPLPPGYVFPPTGGIPPSIAHQRAAVALERETLALERERELSKDSPDPQPPTPAPQPGPQPIRPSPMVGETRGG